MKVLKNIKIEEEIWESFKKISIAEGRTMAKMFEIIFKEYIKNEVKK